MQHLLDETLAAIEQRIAGKRTALAFSGGKDSQACLELLRPNWGALTVYWLNTGDALPETEEVVRRAQAEVPHFVEVKTDVRAWRRQHGDPVDLVPVTAEPIGMMYGMSGRGLVSRFACCFHNLMLPLHECLLRDEVEVVIRGTKLADTGQVPHDGPSDVYDVFLPLLNWSHDDVFSFLNQRGIATSAVYSQLDEMHISAPECLHCTAWWDDNKASYLKRAHPEVHQEYVVALTAVRAELQRHIKNLDHEIGGASWRTLQVD